MGERPTPDAPHPGKGRPPRAPSCSPHSAQSQLARVRAVGSVTGPHARTPPHPQPVGSGPRPHARKDEWSGVRERPTPDTPHQDKRRPPPGTLMLPPQRAKPAHKKACCGVGDGSPRPHPQHPQPVRSGPWPQGRRDEFFGGGRAPGPGRPAPKQEAPPRGALVPPPPRAKPACKSARGGVGDGSRRPHPPHPQPVGSGPGPHARKDEWSGKGERPTADAPHPGKRPPPPPGTLMQPPQRAKPASGSARCGVGDRSPRPHPPHPQQVGSGPRPHPRRNKWSGVGERPTPDAPHPGERCPPGHPHAAPTACKASSQERALWRW